MSAAQGQSAIDADAAQQVTPRADEPPFVVWGRIVGAWGIKGWLKIQPLADDPLSWNGIPKLWLVDASGAEMATRQEVALQSMRLHGDGLVAKLDGVDGRNEAEALAGRLLGAPRDSLPETEEGEYYWGDLLGLSVINPAGVSFGTVKNLLETGANDVLVVSAGDGTERLLPFVGEVVLAVNTERREITVAWELDW